jgi:two-component system chemotaxis response regulator CheY
MSPGERPRAESVSPLRLLAVDDDPDYRAYVRVVAARQGWLVDTADDGDAALELLSNQRFDLLLVDFEMPRLNGLQFIARIRDDESLRNSYAIMLTARGDMDTKIEALTAGFDDFMPKGSSEAEIGAKLLATRRILARQQHLDVTMRRLYGLATRDELTGVFNRRFFIDETQRLLDAEVPVCLVLFDLDDFKVVNDSYGHLAGDRVLRDVGAAFHAGTRGADLIARYGGDEFVLTVTRLPLAAVERVAARLVETLSELRWESGAEPYGISATTGIASSALLPSPTVEQLLNAADRDLYKNKWLRKHPNETVADFESLPPRADIVTLSPLLSAGSDSDEPVPGLGIVNESVRRLWRD